MTTDTSVLKAKGLDYLPAFFAPDEAAALAQMGRHVVQGVADGSYSRTGQFAYGLPAEWFDPVTRSPRLLELIQSHLGPDLCLYAWRVLMKDHHFNGPISIHQDWPYFGGGGPKLNAFIPLTRVHRGNGALVFYEGSHAFGPMERGDIDVSQFPDLGEACPELVVGDVLLADFFTWHYSVPATAVEDRIMLQLVYQPSSDPSSKNLVAGSLRTERQWMPDRIDAMREPVTTINCAMARSLLEAGDLTRAERYARGALASDQGHAEAALLLHDILRRREDPLADHYLAMARQNLDRLTRELNARTPAVEVALEAPAMGVAPPRRTPWSRRWFGRTADGG